MWSDIYGARSTFFTMRFTNKTRSWPQVAFQHVKPRPSLHNEWAENMSLPVRTIAAANRLPSCIRGTECVGSLCFSIYSLMLQTPPHY